MILSATLSKPAQNIEEILGKPFIKIKISYENSSSGASYFLQQFTKTQVFHSHLKEDELEQFLQEHAGKTFKNCVKRTESEEITILSNKKGKITTLTKQISNNKSNTKSKTNIDLSLFTPANISQKKKQYILEEGTPVPFLILLGIMNDEGKVIKARYDKFRQINRFLEFINDTVKEITTIRDFTKENPLKIIDFGCGKSYLTFAVHYFLTEIKHIECSIEGLDLKQDVIDYCNNIAQKLDLKNLIFHTGDIANYSKTQNPDIIITLHACDTATDYALKYAVEKNALAILSVPCCQHQINSQLQENQQTSELFEPLLKYGLIREKFSSLLTDELRGMWLEEGGYKVQMLEFIDEEHTPKNILIKAIRKNKKAENSTPAIIKELNLQPEIWKL